MQLHCLNGMIDFFFFFVCGGGSGRWALYSCACFVIDGGVCFFCEWEMYWLGGDNVAMFSVVEHNVGEERYERL